MHVVLLFFIVLYFYLLLVLNLGQLQICQEYMSDLSLQACLGYVQAQPTLLSTTVLRLLPVHPINSRLNFNFELQLFFKYSSDQFTFEFKIPITAFWSYEEDISFYLDSCLDSHCFNDVMAISDNTFFKFSCSKCCVHTALKLHLRWRSFEINLNL